MVVSSLSLQYFATITDAAGQYLHCPSVSTVRTGRHR